MDQNGKRPAASREGDAGQVQDLGLEGITPHNEKFHWRVQRVRKTAYVLTLIVLTASLAGLFGSGPASVAEIIAADSSFRIEYPRFARLNTPVQLVVRVSQSPPEDRLIVRVGSEYLDAFEVEGITPPPITTRIEPEFALFIFEATKSASIRFSVRFRKYGYIQGPIEVLDRRENISHFVYP